MRDTLLSYRPQLGFFKSHHAKASVHVTTIPFFDSKWQTYMRADDCRHPTCAPRVLTDTNSRTRARQA